MLPLSLVMAALLSPQEPAAPGTTETTGATVTPQASEVKVTEPKEAVPNACERWKAPGLMEGPVFLTYAEADLGVGRRACPRSEVGLGFNFGAIIDTPNFYGNVGIQGLVYGSWALNEKTELFATLEAIDSQFVQNATLSGTKMTLGNMTIGGSRRVYETQALAGAVTARLLLPTESNIPGARNTGAEIGHNVSLRAATFLEVHAYVGVGFTVGLSAANALPAVGFAGLVGAQLSPFDWFSLVVDLSGGLAARTYFAPTVALRFRVFSVGIELAGTRPLAGTDRHDFIMAARVAFRF